MAQDPTLGARVGAQLGPAFAAIHAVDGADAPQDLRRWPLDASPSAASLVLLVAVCAGTDSWIGGFAALVEPPLERCFHDIHP